jgi:hypothetical protein
MADSVLEAIPVRLSGARPGRGEVLSPSPVPGTVGWTPQRTVPPDQNRMLLCDNAPEVCCPGANVRPTCWSTQISTRQQLATTSSRDDAATALCARPSAIW